MTATLLVIHILLAVSLIGVILLQRTSSDGSGLTGGTGAMGGMMSARGTANLLTRTTSLLATGFIVTSIVLTIVGGSGNRPKSIADEIAPAASKEAPAPQAPQSTPAVPLSK